ncbi:MULTISPECIES: Hpt domain-containing protein [Pseudomonas]|uniref:Hpt domain-containing protein n=1 Tax=Pseudomonas TaxID=286 RepID=UPI00137AC1A1|nr:MULTISPECIES: Hpt domain-containing protein [Pseudomonas]MBH3386021.1 Hpt domain-containing protein [Pseudomonas juntendi]MBR7523876.1 Hpt domain-containing protein [Pseudomonas juntendi]WBM34515.1 Hpt domain-containing protein [Pseudomonas sp. NY11382]
MTDMHIDHRVLNDLREVMEDGYLKLVETFLEDSECRVGQLHAAKSAPELRAAAHSFKGSSSNMGAMVLASLCQQLEERARRPPLYGIEDLISRIDLEYKEVERFYRAEKARISAG